MIIIMLGGVGSGKTVSVVRNIIKSKGFSYTNFRLKNFSGYHRLRYEDIMNIEKDKKGHTRITDVNWAFWEKEQEKGKRFSIYLDEVHNIIHSRAAMSRQNKMFSRWVSQIRKILSDRLDSHLYIISQTMRKIDVDFRELAQLVILCEKFEIGKNVYIRQKYYSSIERYELNTSFMKEVFLANPYFKFYDMLKMVKFSDADDYI